MDEDANREAVLSQTIEVLKERVNPEGVLDIQMTPLGTDRIEVVMPLPSKEVKDLASEYKSILDNLLTQSQIKSGDLDRALVEGNALGVFGSEGARGTLVQSLQQLHKDLLLVTATLDINPNDGQLEQSVADIEIDFEDTRNQLLELSLDRHEVTRLLQMAVIGEPLRDAAGLVIRNPETDEVLRGPAPRDVALLELETTYPHLAIQLGELVDSYNDYQPKEQGLMIQKTSSECFAVREFLNSE